MPSSNVRRCSVSSEPSPKRQRSGEPMTDGNNQTQSFSSNAMAVPDNIPMGPHTRSQGFPPAYTELEALSADPIHDNLGKSGRLAAKWISDLISGSLDPESLACDDALTAHNFYTITSQSGIIDAEKGHAVVCICETCKKTFTILFECSGGSCRPGIERMHHIVPLTANTTDPDNKYYPNTYTATYRCSATICRLRLEIQVCEARIPKHIEAALVDRSAAIARLEELIAIEPARYGDLKSPERLQKLLPSYYLLQYLNDVVNLSPGDKRQVSVRNKFFSICFADKMDLFEFLEFPTSVEGDETFVQLLALDDAAPESLQITPFRSKRAWFEVLRIHLSFLLAGIPSNLRPPIDVKAEHSTREILSNILDARYARTAFINVDDYKLSMFNVLGVEKEMHELLLWYACICQNQTDPDNRHAIFEAISHVSQGRESVCTELRSFLENEQIYWATEASKQDAQASTPLTRAYRFFNLPQDGAPVQQVLEAFDSALRNAQSPDDKKNARLNASIIAKAQKSQIIMTSACTFSNAQEALDFVCHDTGTGEMSSDPDFIHAHLVAMADDSGGSFDRLLVASAAKTLADFHGNHEHLEVFAAEQQSLANEPWFTDQLKPSIDYSLPAGLANIRNTCYLNSILQYLHTVVPVRDVIMNWESYKLDPTEANIESRRLGGSGSTLDKGEAFLASKFVEEMRALFLELQTSESKFITPKQRLALAALNTPDRLVKQTIAVEKPATPSFIGPLLPKSTTEPDPDAPPPLPDRPSQKHPIGGQATSKGLTVTVNPVVDSADDISEVSSRTLVDERTEEADRTYVTEPGTDSVPSVVPAKQRSPLEEDDKEMFDRDEVVPATRGRSVTREQDRRDEKDVQMGGLDAGSGQSLEDQIMEALSNETVTGTDQQDVEEVMGNILEHLHAAIKPTGTDASTGKQTDQITETFYWRSRKYIRSIDLKTGKPKSDYRTVDDLSRWMTAFPAVEGQVDLYTALDSSFDQEYQEDGHETFTSITRTSPILHVYIQRSQNLNGRLGRNNNIVEIPETLCLDRYMDGPSDSGIFNKRKRSWNLKRRLQAVNGQAPPEPTATKENQANKPTIKEAGFEVINANVDQYEEALLSMDNTGEGEGEDEYVSILDSDTQQMLAEQNLLPSSTDEDLSMDQATNREAQLAQLDPEASRRIKEKADLEQASIQHELSTLFDGQCEIAYRLHAVICHGGGLTSGHYWVWIYDFKKKVWRKYNDDTVLERSESDTSKVLGELNSSSNPYYVAYVRVDEIDKMVAIPERIQIKREASGFQGGHHVGGHEDQGVIYGVNGDDDIDMEDAQAVHIENRED